MASTPTDETKTLVETPAAMTPRAEGAAQDMGTSVGRYVVLEEVGRGGMGRVLRAYDPKLQREVALKEVRRSGMGSAGRNDRRPGEASEEWVIRLVAEARAMAKLSHPSVVAVYDVEELDGRSGREFTVVMEYVAGGTLHDWLRAHKRTSREIVRMFMMAGRGLAAAHAAGLLHRDFKPTNVLVDHDGHAKVTDFGLAKRVGLTSEAPDSDPDEDTHDSSSELTEAGVILGTPRYMAPEQHRGQNLTAAADQYAFCVALWQALCGEPPFSGRDLGAKKHDGPPAWNNSAVPRVVADAIHRGLSVRASERWPSVDALLEVLDFDPAQRRNRWLGSIGVTALAGVGLAGWMSWTTSQSQRCSGAKEQLHEIWDESTRSAVQRSFLDVDAPYADATWSRAANEIESYADAWATMHTEACEATTIRGEQSTTVMDLKMACLHRRKVELDAVVATLSTADADVVRRAHEIVAQLRPLERCADVEALQSDVEPPAAAEADAVELARAGLAKARAELGAGRYADAKARIETAKAAVVNAEYGPVQTEIATTESSALRALGDFPAAEAAAERALKSAARWQQRGAMAEAAANLLYLVGYEQGRPEEGLRYAGLARGLVVDPRLKAQIHDDIASVLGVQGKYEEAEAQHRRALALYLAEFGPDHVDVASCRNNLAGLLAQQGKYEEAEAEGREALAAYERAAGPEHPGTVHLHITLGAILNERSLLEDAESEHRRALSIIARTLGAGHPSAAHARNNLGLLLRQRGRLAEAEAELRAAIAIYDETRDTDDIRGTTTRLNLASILTALDKHDEAEAEARHGLAQLLKILGPDHPHIGTTHVILGDALAARGKYDEAESEYRAAIELLDRALGPDHDAAAGARSNLARLLAQRDRPDAGQAQGQR